MLNFMAQNEILCLIQSQLVAQGISKVDIYHHRKLGAEIYLNCLVEPSSANFLYYFQFIIQSNLA